MKIYVFTKLNQLLSYIGAGYVFEITKIDDLKDFIYDGDEVINVPDDEFFILRKGELAVLKDGEDLYLVEKK